MGQKDKNYYECYFLFLTHRPAIFILFLKLIHVAKCYLEFDKRREKFCNALHLDVYIYFFFVYFLLKLLLLLQLLVSLLYYFKLILPGILSRTKIHLMY